jgi:plastocyanin
MQRPPHRSTMKSVFAVTGIAVLIAIGSAASPSAAPVRATAQVQVHCPNGPTAAFVTPQQVRVAVGDTVEWRMTGQVLSDTLVITLKDSTQAWPFTGSVPVGQSSAATGRATTVGTYGYAVRLLCRQPNGGALPVVIDPDIIVE